MTRLSVPRSNVYSYVLHAGQIINLLQEPSANRLWSLRGMHIDNTSRELLTLHIQSPRGNSVLTLSAPPQLSFMYDGPPEPLDHDVWALVEGHEPLHLQLWVSEIELRPTVYSPDRAQGFHGGAGFHSGSMSGQLFSGSIDAHWMQDMGGPYSWARPPRIDQAIPVGPGDPSIRHQMEAHQQQVKKKNKDARIEALIERVVEE